MVKYLATVRVLERRFQGFTLKYIPRTENLETDELAEAIANNLPILQVLATQATTKAFKQVLQNPKTRDS